MNKITSVLNHITTKKLVLVASMAIFSASNAMAFSETEFRAAVKQLIASPGSGPESGISHDQYVANAVSTWLNQDYVNSVGQAEIDAARQASQHAASSFNNLLKQEPGNPLLMSYAGAATAKSSLEKIAKGEKTTALEDGTAMVEQALQLAGNSQAMHGSVPVALEVRFVAASTFLAVPRIMNRKQQGEQLLNEVLGAQQFSQTDLNFRGAVWLRAATLAMEQQRADDARKFLTEIVKNNAPQSRSATELLQKLS
ncbi:hypothetical protein H8L32_05470 [Undibacterium sp. CY18W]|uniref:Tetratricopeptide repeat protein n=1 Tax=Undibacterium hunanense TaxID=2762292 RepID=A0ABR6ZMV3_9BURK|nr:hypothetical protein [Undibacterium hunanense]MBC3916919.1 hypothetical protein [Undibacterium hunanense]